MSADTYACDGPDPSVLERRADEVFAADRETLLEVLAIEIGAYTDQHGPVEDLCGVHALLTRLLVQTDSYIAWFAEQYGIGEAVKALGVALQERT
jgi:hypothetical protein